MTQRMVHLAGLAFIHIHILKHTRLDQKSYACSIYSVVVGMFALGT